MGKSLTDIAHELQSCKKKSQLIYAFNGTGKTRLSREFKALISPKSHDEEDDISELSQKKILYYSSFTEDLFYWDNDLENDFEVKLKIHPNAFTHWVFQEQGLENEVINNFQRYTNEKLTPNFNEPYEIKNSSGHIVNMLYFSYGVGSPCRITHTVFGLPPCMKNKSH